MPDPGLNCAEYIVQPTKPKSEEYYTPTGLPLGTQSQYHSLNNYENLFPKFALVLYSSNRGHNAVFAYFFIFTVQTEATAAQLSQQCSNDALIQLSTEIADYNGFKVKLGLSDAEINAIDQSPVTINGRFYAALKKWKSKGMFDRTATYGRLMEIAKKKGDAFAFQRIQSTCTKYASK